MHVTELSDGEQQARLADSIDGLQRTFPEFTAVAVLTARQRRGLLILIAAVIAAAVVDVNATAIAIVALATAFYSAVILDRVALFRASLLHEAVVVISDDEARSYPDDLLPVYTVLIPAYKEPEVIHALLGAMNRLEYPREKLDIKLLLEADDAETIAAARDVELGDYSTIILVPPAEPRTKPKALNYGLSLSRGELVTIFDAEDLPDPLQLRRAAIALTTLPREVACVQAKLSYANANQNMITRWFTIEYCMWFSLFLPGLVAKSAPLPLGGTSNHFRREVLEELGAWDAFNVTEDADLGIRLHRAGYRARVLDSTTLEEANSDFVNWMKQRSRWYKGYLQTWLIHLRRPRQLLDELGLRPFLRFNLFVGGTPVLAVLNPVFWCLTIVWFVAHPHFIRAIFPAAVFYAALVCWVVGNFLIAYLTLLTVRLARTPRLIAAALIVPAYWVMMSIAATKALLQLVLAPSFWEKTTHGLGEPAQ